MAADAELYALAEKVGQHLSQTGRRMVTAESCTGGWIAKAVTDVPGSSAWFECSFVTYGDPAKAAMLGVAATTLESEGAVSRAAVHEMAAGALERSTAHVSVAVSGIAGPDGATLGKSVGTVWFAWATRAGHRITVNERMKFLDGDRDTVRRKAVAAALKGILNV